MTIAPPRRPDSSVPAATGEPHTVLGRLAALVLRHRRIVIVGWLVLLLTGGMAAGQVSKRLSFDFSLPGQPGYETAARIIHTYGNGGDQPPAILVVTAPAGESATANQAVISRAFSAVRQAEPTLRVIDYGTTGDSRFLTDNGRSTYTLVFTPPVNGFGSGKQIDDAETVLGQHLRGYNVGLTGLNQLASGGNSKGPGVLVETIFGGLGALIVLAFVFASFLALLPLLVAATSILTTFLVVLGLTYLTQVSFIVEFLIALVGLGIAIDYSLLLVTRWREERARGSDNATAVITAMETAGRAVVLSGLTVGIGLAALVVLPVPGLRSTGIGGMLIPLVSILVVITLLPALLGGIGPRGRLAVGEEGEKRQPCVERLGPRGHPVALGRGRIGPRPSRPFRGPGSSDQGRRDRSQFAGQERAGFRSLRGPHLGRRSAGSSLSDRGAHHDGGGTGGACRHCRLAGSEDRSAPVRRDR